MKLTKFQNKILRRIGRGEPVMKSGTPKNIATQVKNAIAVLQEEEFLNDKGELTDKGFSKYIKLQKHDHWNKKGDDTVSLGKKKKQGNKAKRDPEFEPDWGGTCEVCGQSPIVPATGMCGPCTFGEAETAGGNW